MGPDQAGERNDPLGLMILCGVAVIGGLAVGVIGGAFRWTLDRADTARAALLVQARDLPGPSWLLPAFGVAGCAALARYIVRRVPTAGGSGIQDVEATWRGEAPAVSARVLPAKFVGGALAIGSGLALGREGPTVHMGAAVGSVAGRRLRLDPDDVRVLQAAFGGAGLAVAFNAPLGGAVFVFEEITKSFRTRLVLVTLIGCGSAIVASRAILADLADFAVDRLTVPAIWQVLVFATFGLLTGLLGALYNRVILGTIDLSRRFAWIGAEAQAALVGAFVGIVLFIDPLASGSGHALSQRLLDTRIAFLPLLAFALIRFVIGPLCYSTGTPGGLFSPLLAVGALWGILFQVGLSGLFPGLTVEPAPFAIVGMAAFFTGVVRSPLTGVVLVAEMTATTTLFLPLLAGAVAALLSASLVGSEPIYDSLWKRRLPAEAHVPPLGRPPDME